MGLKDRLHNLRKTMRGHLDSFELADGTRYYFEPEKAWIALFRFWSVSLRAAHRGNPRPEPPDVLRAVAGAKDRRRALEAVYPPPPVAPPAAAPSPASTERSRARYAATCIRLPQLPVSQ